MDLVDQICIEKEKIKQSENRIEELKDKLDACKQPSSISDLISKAIKHGNGVTGLREYTYLGWECYSSSKTEYILRKRNDSRALGIDVRNNRICSHTVKTVLIYEDYTYIYFYV
jgi:hypothetical protein